MRYDIRIESLIYSTFIYLHCRTCGHDDEVRHRLMSFSGSIVLCNPAVERCAFLATSVGGVGRNPRILSSSFLAAS